MSCCVTRLPGCVRADLVGLPAVQSTSLQIYLVLVLVFVALKIWQYFMKFGGHSSLWLLSFLFMLDPFLPSCLGGPFQCYSDVDVEVSRIIVDCIEGTNPFSPIILFNPVRNGTYSSTLPMICMPFSH